MIDDFKVEPDHARSKGKKGKQILGATKKGKPYKEDTLAKGKKGPKASTYEPMYEPRNSFAAHKWDHMLKARWTILLYYGPKRAHKSVLVKIGNCWLRVHLRHHSYICFTVQKWHQNKVRREVGGKTNPSKRSQLVNQPTDSDEDYQAPQTKAKKQTAALLPATSAKVGSASTPQTSNTSGSKQGSRSASQSTERTHTHIGGKPSASSPMESSSKYSGSKVASESGGSNKALTVLPSAMKLSNEESAMRIWPVPNGLCRGLRRSTWRVAKSEMANLGGASWRRKRSAQIG
ncbi:hypothetical protein HAX54_047841 [Datura stramonium]|uniref:Uncharacterized protein n=1 Tax=Datura stramonium TaxID=4076 RepID=A0ABS8WND4_DATST|nr:hypothetical protein [Datura stramonium]